MTTFDRVAEVADRAGDGELRTPVETRQPKAVPHPTTGERAAMGRAVRATLPRSAHGEWEPRPAGEIRSSCSRSRPRRAYRSSCRSATAGCWSRRSRSSAGRRYPWPPIWRTPRGRARGAALRRRPPVQLRRLRRARQAPGLQRQRLRRDAARPVRVGRQAAGGELRGRRAGSRLRRRAARRSINADRGARLPRGDARLRRDAQPRRSGTPALDVDEIVERWPPQGEPRSRSSGSSTTWPRRGRRTA